LIRRPFLLPLGRFFCGIVCAFWPGLFSFSPRGTFCCALSFREPVCPLGQGGSFASSFFFFVILWGDLFLSTCQTRASGCFLVARIFPFYLSSLPLDLWCPIVLFFFFPPTESWTLPCLSLTALERKQGIRPSYFPASQYFLSPHFRGILNFFFPASPVRGPSISGNGGGSRRRFVRL